MSEELARILDLIAERLGPTAQSGWEILVAYQRLLGTYVAIATTVWIILVSLVAIGTYRFTRDHYDRPSITTASTFVTALLLLVLLMLMWEAVGHMVVPEYYAVEKLLRGLR